jgi:predicted lysophospholipase L1 biosynthesis ABC-type transport system permease subunit
LNPSHSIADNLARAQKVFNTYNPDYPFEYNFVDEAYAEKYNTERKEGTLAAIFTGLIIFISCLGLFGLAAYMAETRIKEIGIRKVLGASVMNITTLLSGDFMKLVCIALVIATPIAWVAMHQWLSEYAYRTELSIWVFVVCGLGALVISLATVSSQAIKSALANPVKSLKNE